MHQMTLAASTQPRSAAATASQAAPRVRDLRLDFFRGLAMFIILMAHIQDNRAALWIPARWGFSDATEIFVFCSGMASAIAFGGTFSRAGWPIGTARVLFRVWQVYWAHIGLFFATLALTVWLTSLDITGVNYWGQLNLWSIFEESDQWENPDILLNLMTLRWVPNYFDILPMYMVVLLMMPLVMALARVDLRLVVVFVLVVWLMAQRSLMQGLGLGWLHLELPAEPWSDRPWFFNPFGWQLIFFTGFAFMRGWLPKPPVTPALMALAAVIVLANIPLSDLGARFGGDWVRDWRLQNMAWYDKTDFAVLRYVHFLALAYLAWVLAGDRGDNLLSRGESTLAQGWRGVLAVILKVGQQSLAVFVASMFLARFLGFWLDIYGRSIPVTTLINLIGIVLLVVVAYGAGWFKSQPWRARGTK